MILLELLILANIIVFVIDISGFIQEMETLIWKKWLRKYPREAVSIPKPFSCSLCLTFWTGLAYLLLTHSLTIPLIGYVCLLAFLTPVISDFLMGVREILISITEKLK